VPYILIVIGLFLFVPEVSFASKACDQFESTSRGKALLDSIPKIILRLSDRKVRINDKKVKDFIEVCESKGPPPYFCLSNKRKKENYCVIKKLSEMLSMEANRRVQSHKQLDKKEPEILAFNASGTANVSSPYKLSAKFLDNDALSRAGLQTGMEITYSNKPYKRYGDEVVFNLNGLAVDEIRVTLVPQVKGEEKLIFWVDDKASMRVKIDHIITVHPELVKVDNDELDDLLDGFWLSK